MRYVAFLRAVNVGGRVVKMEHLRRLFETAGFERVETFIASGNVVFDAPRKSAASLEIDIQTALQKGLGYPVATFLRTLPDVAEIAGRHPFGPEEADVRFYIGFLRDAPSSESQKKIRALSNEVDEFRVHGRELYWMCRKKLMESTVSGAGLEKLLRGDATFRNVSTVRKIAAKYCGH